ncbi:MAG: LPXTG cell wall anchor domain-containing protein [Lachnospiraceae bacterium]
MMKMRKRNGSCLGAGRMRETLVRWGGVFAVLAIICAAAFPAITKTKDMAGRLDGVGVSIEAADGAIPDDASLVLNRVLLPGAGEEGDGPEDGSPRRLTEYEAEKILKAARNGDGTVEGKILNVVDISLEHKGSEIEPSDAVRLRIQSDLIRKANQPAIVHLDDKGNAALFTALDENGETICLDENDKASARDMESTMLAKSEEPVLKGVDELSGMTDSFSVYAIVDLVANSQGSEENVSTEPFEFADSTGNVDVHVSAPASAFPAGTTMRLSMVETGDVMNTVSQAVGGEIAVVQAVDIAFCNAEGVEIEPSEPINVTMRPHGTEIDAENSKLVHIGAEETTVVDNASFDGEQVTFDSDEFSTYAIIIILGAPGEHIYEGDGVTIKVSYGKDAGLPNGTEMVIRELEKGTPEYEEYFARTEKALNMDEGEIDKENISLGDQFEYLFGGGYKLTDARIYDIELFYNGAKIEPAAPVNVEIHYDDADKVDDENMKIVHFADDGTEIISDLDVKSTRKSGATISYQQGSFSRDAVAVANSYGNRGWVKDNRMEILYGHRYMLPGDTSKTYLANEKPEGAVPVFELTYLLNGSRPFETGYPVRSDSGIFNPGTTIEQIINALAINPNSNELNGVCVDFVMLDTYTVNSTNRTMNGHKEGSTEQWGNKNFNVKVTRGPAFGGCLLDIATEQGMPMHMFNNVIIDNAATMTDATKTKFDNKETDARISQPVAIKIRVGGLLMMMNNSYITDTTAQGYGTGILLTTEGGNKGGNLELFDNSSINKMAVAIEQEYGKTRLKNSPNPLGGRDNTIGVALHPGQSIGKWIDSIDKSQPVPVFLRDVKEWKSGNIVMDSGYKDVNGTAVKVDVKASDMNKLVFENAKQGQSTNTRMGLEYVKGTGKEPYPVIQFYVGTVLNTRTGEWYATLHDAVLGVNPVKAPTDARPGVEYIKDGDTLEFYGDTLEGQNVTINYNLTIRSSTENREHQDGYGHPQTAVLSGTTITINNGKTVTFEGGTGGLTLAGSGGNTIIGNNGTLNLKDGITLSGAKYAVKQNGTFNLYGRVTFNDNKTADVRLEEENKYITLQTVKPASNVRVELANKFNGRDVVVAGEEESVRETLDETYLDRFPLTNLAGDEDFTYVYNETGGPDGVRVLELKQRGRALIKITKVDEKDNTKIKGVEFTIYDVNGNQYECHETDENGETSFTVKAGTYTIKETRAAPGYRNNMVEYQFTVTESDDKFSINNNAFTAESDGTTFSVTVTNTPKMADVQFFKTDGTNPLADVEFALYDIDPATPDASPVYTGTSDGSGNIVWKNNQKNLNFRVRKDYWLVETTPLAGYAPLPATKITIKDDKNDGNYTVETDNGSVTGKLEGSTVKITVVNNPGKPLPNTGGIGTTIYTAIGLALIVIAGLAFLAARNRRKGYGRI